MSRRGLPLISLLLVLSFLLTDGLLGGGLAVHSNPDQEFDSREDVATETGPSSSPIANAASPFYALVVAGSESDSFGDGNVYRYVRGNLSFIARPTTSALMDVGWRPGGAYALIAGFGATLLKYDGNTFTALNPGVPSATNFYEAAWRPDGAFALISGSSGTLLRYDGSSFTSVPTGVTATLRDIGWRSNSYATIVGSGGTMLIYENDQIRPIISGTTSYLHDVAWNPNGQYALVAGANGTILRHDGFVNTVINTTGIYNPTHIVRSIKWNNTAMALISGDTGLVLTYNGTSLVRQTLDGSPNATQNNLNALDWFQGNATIVGGQGTILEFSGTLRKFANATNAPLRDISWRPYVTLSASYSLTPSTPYTGSAATFSAFVSGGIPPYSFTWNFGDGAAGTGNQVSHSFSTPGNFSVVLTSTDSEGSTVTTSRTVAVSPWPPNLFEFDWADYDNDGQVSILDLSVTAICYGSTPSATSWSGCSYWDLDLSQKISINDVSHVAFYYGTSYVPPFPGQGEATGHMDGLWEGFCFVLPLIDQQYCLANT